MSRTAGVLAEVQTFGLDGGVDIDKQAGEKLQPILSEVQRNKRAGNGKWGIQTVCGLVAGEAVGGGSVSGS